MLNEERIILMTKLASYESGEGKKCAATGSYFRSDYDRVRRHDCCVRTADLCGIFLPVQQGKEKSEELLQQSQETGISLRKKLARILVSERSEYEKSTGNEGIGKKILQQI